MKFNFLFVFLIFILINYFWTIKLKKKDKRCSDYLPKVSYPDMNKSYVIGEEYHQRFNIPVKQSDIHSYYNGA